MPSAYTSRGRWFAGYTMRVLLASAIALISPRLARAEQTPSRSYTLSEVLGRAAQNSRDVMLALATLNRVRAEASLVEAGYFPTLTGRGSGGAIYDNRLVVPGQPRIDSKGLDARGSLIFDWTLVDVARGKSVRAARSETAAEVESTVATRQQALSAALAIFLTALTADQLVNDAALTVERRNSQQAAVAGLVRAGVRPRVDEQRAQIEVLNARAVLKTRQLERAASHAALAAAMGDDPMVAALPLPLGEPALGAPAELREAVRLAESNRPETRELTRRLEARKADVAAAIGARLPTVGVSGSGNASYFKVLSGQGIDGAQYDASGALYLNWAALDVRVWRRAKQARAAYEEAARRLERTRLELRREVVAAHYALQSAETRLEQAVAVLSVAAVTREAQNERYRAGLSSLLELLDAEDVEQRARQARIEAELANLKAQGDLLAACGLMDRLTEDSAATRATALR